MESLPDYVLDSCGTLQIRKYAPKAGTRRTEYLLSTGRYSRKNPEKAYVTSMPEIRCTFLGDDFYLRPGTQNHPDNQRNPVLPDNTATRIRTLQGESSLFVFLFSRIRGHGSGCTTALSGMHRYLYRVYCPTPPTSLCSDNTQNLHSPTLERISKCPHPRPKVNALGTH